jgi:antagonist of KipI
VVSFRKAAIICITGADFTASIDEQEIHLNQPALVDAEGILRFKKAKHGARSYLSVLNDFAIKAWLNSYSTNLKAVAGGLHGRALKTGDIIPFDTLTALSNYCKGERCKVLHWKAEPAEMVAANKIEVIEGSEWGWLDETSQQSFLESSFEITKVADRMGFRLSGTALQLKEQKQLVSSAVTFGTLQLLPSGQLILLMADHQTTGGYPRVANVISAHLPRLAQSKPDDAFSFALTNIKSAEKKLLDQFNYLQKVQHAAHFEIEKILQ